jgi:hypothetical protein
VPSITRIARALALALLVLGPATAARAQSAATPAPVEPPIDAERLSPREVQRLFDAYVAMQAQERLQLSETQYPQFLPRLKTLLDVRRRALQTRQSLLIDLAQGSVGTSDERALRDKLARLKAFDEQIAAELRQAYEAIDQVLDVRQQARFRVFEDQVERRKVELLMRARQNIRSRLRAQPR